MPRHGEGFRLDVSIATAGEFLAGHRIVYPALEGFIVLHQVSKIEGSRVLATNGEIGEIKDIYFDDELWIIRYLIVNTRGWLRRRKVLISPLAVSGVDSTARTVGVSLDRERIDGSPDIDSEKPVSRQHEADFAFYYGYPAYWPNSQPLAGGPLPVMPPFTSPGRDQLKVQMPPAPPDSEPVADSHLRSTSEVTGYDIQATDANVGHVEDFLFDDTTWLIQHMVVDTRNWLPGKHVLVSAGWIGEINWPQRVVKVARTRDQVRQRPKFDPQRLPDTVALPATQAGAADSVSRRPE